MQRATSALIWLWWREVERRRAPCGPNLAVPGSVSRITETLCSSLLDVSRMSSPSTIPVHADISVTSTRVIPPCQNQGGKKSLLFGTGLVGGNQNQTGVKGQKHAGAG